MGKMIDGPEHRRGRGGHEQTGGRRPHLRFVFLHSLVLAILVGLLTLVQAYLLPWTIPAM